MVASWSGFVSRYHGSWIIKLADYACRNPKPNEYGILHGVPVLDSCNFYTYDVDFKQLKSSKKDGAENCTK